MKKLRVEISESRLLIPSKPSTRPPRSVKLQPQGWDDGFAKAVNQNIPTYNVAKDKHATGYISGLQRQRKLKQYLNLANFNNDRDQRTCYKTVSAGVAGLRKNSSKRNQTRVESNADLTGFKVVETANSLVLAT